MKISELIEKLEQIKLAEGDLPICVTSEHEYWGTLYRLLEFHNIEITDNARPDGPKSGKSITSVIFTY